MQHGVAIPAGVSGPPPARRTIRLRWLSAALLTLLLACLVLPPIATVLRMSLQPDSGAGTWTLAGYVRLFTGDTLYAAAWN